MSGKLKLSCYIVYYGSAGLILDVFVFLPQIESYSAELQCLAIAGENKTFMFAAVRF